LGKNSGEKFRKAIELIPEFLPNVKRIFSEPGKALAQPSMAVAMQILEIRDSLGEPTEVVVDGSIANFRCIFSIRTVFYVRTAKAAIGNL
jgi:diaminopimelate decarboxylase